MFYRNTMRKRKKKNRTINLDPDDRNFLLVKTIARLLLEKRFMMALLNIKDLKIARLTKGVIDYEKRDSKMHVLPEGETESIHANGEVCSGT